MDNLYYALKPNGEKVVLKVLNSINANFEVASVGEFHKLKSLGVESNRIICSLPVKPIQWLQHLYTDGVRYFVFDNVNEYNKLKKYAPESKKIVRIDITDIATDTIEYGMPLEGLLNSFDDLIKDIDGVTFFLSHNHHIDVLLGVLDRCDIILEHIGVNKIVNIGGNYRLPCDLQSDFYDILNERLRDLREKHACTIYSEPGRSVVKNAGSLIITVECVKNMDKVTYVYIEAGIPTGISYGLQVIQRIAGREEAWEIERTYKFYDITCSHRILFEYRTKDVYSVGDVLELKDFGCYSISKSSQFHGWDLPEVTFKD